MNNFNNEIKLILQQYLEKFERIMSVYYKTINISKH